MGIEPNNAPQYYTVIQNSNLPKLSTAELGDFADDLSKLMEEFKRRFQAEPLSPDDEAKYLNVLANNYSGNTDWKSLVQVGY